MLGKSSASVVQKRIEELPTKTTAPDGGGLVASAAVSRSMSFAQDSGAAGACPAGKIRTSSERKIKNTGRGRPALVMALHEKRKAARRNPGVGSRLANHSSRAFSRAMRI